MFIVNQYMNNQIVITLLSDFGDRHIYPAVMKGVICQINPDVRMIDLTHQIPAQNIAAARFCLMSAYYYFPVGTIHLAVVDPGVGSKRRAIAVKFSQGYLVGPDNGLFSGVLAQNPAIKAVELTNLNYWRTLQPSTTFHGRDIFAPVAAHLSKGVSLGDLGAEIDLESLVKLDIGQCDKIGNTITGCIQYIDDFGNLISNIPASYIYGKNWCVKVGNLTIPNGETYSSVNPGKALALVGSHDFVEIAVNSGNAQTQLQINWQDKIEVILLD